MKKNLSILMAAAAMTCCMAFPAFAAETKAEYKEEVAPIRTEIKALDAEMKPLREDSGSVSAKYKAIRLEKKNTGTLSISKENWKKAKELHGKIAEIRKSNGTETAKSLKAAAKAALKENNFNSAIENTDRVLELKKERLETLKDINDIWNQIDELL